MLTLSRPPRLALAGIALGVLLTIAAWWQVFRVGATSECLELMYAQRAGLTLTWHVFRPVWDAWFWLGLRCFGVDGYVGWHAAQLALHAANGLLLALLARRLGLSLLACWCSGLLFVLSPAAVDAVAWLAAVNRPLSATGALVFAYAMASPRRDVRSAALAVGGLAFQFLANEEVYGTLLLCIAWLFWRSLRGERGARRRNLLGAAGAVAAMAIHYGALRGTDQPWVVASGWSLADAAKVFLANALTRTVRVAAAVSDPYGTIVLLAAVPLCAVSDPRAERRRATVLALAMLAASFVPFALDGGGPYRDYPTIAPLLLLAGVAIDRVGWLSRRLPSGLASAAAVATAAIALLLVCVFAGWGARARSLQVWEPLTREVRECQALLSAHVAPGDPLPVFVNLEVRARSVMHFAPTPLLDVDNCPAIAFLDTPRACVPPAGFDGFLPGRAVLAHGDDGSIRIMRGEELLRRPRAPEWMLCRRFERSDSYEQSLRTVASGAIDPRNSAVIEIGEADAPRWAEPECHANVIEQGPIEMDVAALAAHTQVRVSCAEDCWLVAQHAVLFGSEFHTLPEYAWLWRLHDPRCLTMRVMTADGRDLPVRRAQVHGFAALLPVGEHVLTVRFSATPPR
jgi:hypothetical protein